MTDINSLGARLTEVEEWLEKLDEYVAKIESDVGWRLKKIETFLELHKMRLCDTCVGAGNLMMTTNIDKEKRTIETEYYPCPTCGGRGLVEDKS